MGPEDGGERRTIVLQNEIDDLKRRLLLAEVANQQWAERVTQLLVYNNQFEQRAREAEREVRRLEAEIDEAKSMQDDRKFD